MNTGHDGSLATGHSNSPRDMIARLETMVLLAGVDLPIKAIREQIASAIDVIIQQSRLKDGSRKITNITEVQGMEGDMIVLQDIFVFKQEGLTPESKIIGRLVPTGVRPKFHERLELSGNYIPASVYIENEERRQ
jgi:pilus assembly protein CpaF